MRALLVGAVAVLAGMASSPSPARAGVVAVSGRSALSGPTIGWSGFGSPGQTVSTPASQTFGAETVSVGSSAGIVEIRQQGTDFNGNFATGDTLLSLPDGYRSDNFQVRFSGAPVYGVGTQIQPVSGYYGGFTAYLDLYGAGQVLLGEVSVAGNSTSAGDGSAVFIGATSTTAIADVIFSVATGYPGFPREGDLAINQMTLATAVAEPAAAWMLAAGLVSLPILRSGALRRRRPEAA